MRKYKKFCNEQSDLIFRSIAFIRKLNIAEVCCAYDIYVETYGNIKVFMDRISICYQCVYVENKKMQRNAEKFNFVEVFGERLKLYVKVVF